jgi:hypothetical protein
MTSGNEAYPAGVAPMSRSLPASLAVRQVVG